MASAGINTKQGKNMVKKMETYLANMEQHLNSLADDVKKLNETGWYGGKRADKTYTKIINNYANNVKYYTMALEVTRAIDTFINGVASTIGGGSSSESSVQVNPIYDTTTGV